MLKQIFNNVLNYIWKLNKVIFPDLHVVATAWIKILVWLLGGFVLGLAMRLLGDNQFFQKINNFFNEYFEKKIELNVDLNVFFSIIQHLIEFSISIAQGYHKYKT